MTPTSTHPAGAPRRLRGGLALSVLMLASLGAYGASILADRAFFFRDVLHYYWPTRHAADVAWRALELPEWFSGALMGIPLLGDPHAAVLYPPNLLYLLLSFPRAYAVLLVLHHVLGGLGVYVLCRRSTASAWAGLAGGLTFMLSGYVSSLSWAGPLMAGGAYVPWVLVALGWKARPLHRALTVAALCALQALSGDPQSVVFSGLAAGALLLWQRPTRERVGVLVGGFGLAAVLAAVQLLPAWMLLVETTRSAARSIFATEWALHPARLLELFFALPFGNYFEQPQFWAAFTVQGPANTPFALSAYLGASTAALGLLGLRRQRDSGFAITLVLGGLLLALAPSVGLERLLTHVPPFRFFRYPEKYLFLVALGWALLVAGGLARALEAQPLPHRRLRVGAGLLLLVGAAWGASYIARGPALSFFAALLHAADTGGSPELPLGVAQDSVKISLGMAALMAGLLVLVRRRPGRPVGPLLVLVLVAVDLLLPIQRVTWLEDIALYDLPSRVAEGIQANLPDHPVRYWRDKEGLEPVGPRGRDLVALSTKRVWDIETLQSNLGVVKGLEESSGYGAIELKQQVVLRMLYFNQPVRALALMNTCFVLTADDGVARYPGTQQLATWPELRTSLLRLPTCMPRLRGVAQVLHAATPGAALKLLRAEAFDASTQVVVEDESPVPDGTVEQHGALALEEVRHGQKQVTARVRAGAGGAYAVLASSYSRGWEARVDGEAVPVERVNFASMGVHVPEGAHTLEFRYTSPGLHLGAAVSGLGLLLAAAALAWEKRRRLRARSVRLDAGAAAAPAPLPEQGSGH